MKKLLSLVLALALALSVAGCGAAPASDVTSAPAESASASAPAQQEAVTLTDRAGNEFTLPQEVKTVISMAPSITHTLIDLGCKDKIVAVDTNSAATIPEVANLPAFDMMTPDAEQMGALTPDLVLVSGITMWDGSEPFKPLQEMGISFAAIPTSATVNDVYLDIEFVGAAMGMAEQAKAINDRLKADLDAVAAKTAEIPEEERKTVYFEIAAAPDFYSTGAGTYLDELITLAGGKNVMADQQSWIGVSAENIAAANPDVIFTNTNYIPDAVGALLSQEGWSQVTAIANRDVYYIDNMASSLPNENIIVAVEQMAQILYPDVFEK